MKPELMLLLWSVALMFAQMLVSTIGAQLQVGLPMLAGNHEKFPEITGWAGRARRAYYNMIDNMVLFVPLVLVAVMLGKTNDSTLLGAQLFFWARLVYAFVYLIGIPWVRTGVWAVSVVGLIMIFVQLV
jgi:uncharacterized MAPEG superfamily protein